MQNLASTLKSEYFLLNQPLLIIELYLSCAYFFFICLTSVLFFLAWCIQWGCPYPSPGEDSLFQCIPCGGRLCFGHPLQHKACHQEISCQRSQRNKGLVHTSRNFKGNSWWPILRLPGETAFILTFFEPGMLCVL